MYGSQRLISTLDWVNTRRTFQGVKGFWRTPHLRPGCFLGAANGDPEKDSFDNWDEKTENSSACGGHIDPMKGQLPISISSACGTTIRKIGEQSAEQQHQGRFKSRIPSAAAIAGDYNQFLYELEGMYQFGQYSQPGSLCLCSRLGRRIPFQGRYR